MCTCLIAGKKTTCSGSVLLGANDDWDKTPGVLKHVPEKQYLPGDKYRLVGGGEIPQTQTSFGYSYTACAYSIGTLDCSWAGGVNQKNVAVAGTGVNAFQDIACDGALLEPDDIPLLILQRAASARQGIQMIGALVAQYGLAPSSLDGNHSVATFAVADANEGWFLEMAPGNHWIATRVPDDQAGVRVNAFGTHDADLTDSENVLFSPGLADYARAQRWWDGDERHFDFAQAYGADHSPNEWGPELAPMNMRRRWRAVSLLSGMEEDENAQIYTVKPNRLLGPESFMAVLRDVYEGTPYDLRKAEAAGRYGNPFHDDPEDYSLCRHATVASFVTELSRGVMWVAMACPAMSAYVPIYTDINELPPSCSQASLGENEWPSLFWEWKELGYLIQRRYRIHSEMVRQAVKKYEESLKTSLMEEAGTLAALPKDARRAKYTALTHMHIARARSLCRSLHIRLAEEY